MIRYLHIILPLLIAITAALADYQQWFSGIDRESYDALQRFNTLPGRTDIIIVAIDEQSLSTIGRWPWPRNTHAALINKLTEAGVRAVALDILFSETSDPQADQALSTAIKNNKKIVLPIYFEQTRSQGQLIEVPPIPAFSEAAAALGHAHINCETDGICRSVFLKEGVGGPQWPHFSLALHELINATATSDTSLPGTRAGYTGGYSPMLIYRDFYNLLPFQKESSTIQISYADVLLNKIPQELLADKIVFVGATATGVHDIMPTPSGRMPGIEINSLIYQSLSESRLIQELPPLTGALILFCLLLPALYAVSHLSPAYFLLSIITLSSLATVCSALLLILFDLWYSPVTFVVFVGVFYPLWSWLRLELAIAFLHRSLKRIQRESASGEDKTYGSSIPSNDRLGELLYGAEKVKKRPSGTEVVSRTIEQYKQANQGLEVARQLVFQSLSKLQEAVLIFSNKNQLIFDNEQAAKLFAEHSKPTNLEELENVLEITDTIKWSDIVIQLQQADAEVFLEAHTQLPSSETIDLVVQGRNIVIWRPSKEETRKHTSIILLTITDVSLLKKSERSRQETLNFISHDLRSPLVSILALSKHIRSENDIPDFFGRALTDIEHYASRNLEMAENLLQLNKAETIDHASFVLCDLHSIADAAYSQARAAALDKSITVEISRCNNDLWVMANSHLLERAIINLLYNAIKYSPEHSRVSLSLSLAGDNSAACVAIADQGPGIAENEKAQIFKKFGRGNTPKHSAGAGLGLHFVETVARRHKGKITFENNHLEGVTFSLTMPLTNI